VHGMNGKFPWAQPFTGYRVTLLVGFLAVVAVSPVIAQSSIEKAQPFQMAQSSPIEGSWRLANIVESPTPTPMVPPKTPELTAEFTGDRVSGSGGCNRFMGGYTIKGDQLSIGPLASTFKACEESIMKQEAKYLKALEGAQRYEVDDQGLQIFYQTEQTSGVLRFTSKAVQGLW
jgi:heat shock protein HslJ